jgi:hypothetical protein
MLLVMGGVLLSAGGLPVMTFFHMGEPLQTVLVASKLVMLPLGAICLMGAAGLRVEHR